jgi:hypothetical protein
MAVHTDPPALEPPAGRRPRRHPFKLVTIETEVKAMPARDQACLINRGHAIADAGLSGNVEPEVRC